jgi:hypothetical protein
MKRWIMLMTVTLAAVLLLGSSVGLAVNYAVLIEGDAPTWFDEFWNDTLLMFEILVDNGFDPDDIFVLYNLGTDYASANPRYQPGSAENGHLPATITDFAATIANVTMVFNGLASGDPVHGIPQMTANDFLFVWTFDHGGFDDPNSNWTHDPGEPTYLCLTDGDMYATTFATLVDAITYARRVFVMQQCHSGGFIPHLSNNNTVILTAAGLENAHPADDTPSTENEVVGGTTYHHGEFNYHMMNALHWLTPTRTAVTGQDTNGNKSPAMDEVFNWVQANETQVETPQYDDPGGIGDVVHIPAEDPGIATDVFMRDHVHWTDTLSAQRPPDAGSVPSNLHGEPMWISPDILVDSNLDGIADPNPEFGQANYIYANVYNFNVNTAAPIDVDFYWADPTVGLSWPADWNFIGTGTITTLAAGGHVTTPHTAGDNVTWWPPNPAVNSHYCLLAILDTSGDAPMTLSGSINDEVANDNNIAWRNVTVVDAYSGYSHTFQVHVANPFDEPADIELTLLGVPKGWWVQAEVACADVLGSPQVGEARRAITLPMKPRERRILSTTITIPDDVSPGTEMPITIVAKVKGRVIGGYTYIVRVRDFVPPICQVCVSLYDKLLDIDPDGRIIPELVTSWEISEDGHTVFLHLRKDVAFHDGSPLNGEAVAFNLTREFSLFLNHDRAPLIDSDLVQEVEVIDDYTLRITLSKPQPDMLLRMLTGIAGMIASPEAVEKLAGQYPYQPVGTGPFLFDELVSGDHVTLLRNKDYWGGAPSVKELIYREIPDEAPRWAALINGEIQAMVGANPEIYYMLKENREEYIVCGSETNYQVVLNAVRYFVCFPDGALRFGEVFYPETLVVGLPWL